ncbi:2-hydroxyacid dehydrogenase [Gudongella sp. SC589]|jgi:gluconate 2-dehydrogenase|uniref:2-hydroxyacid dehydrogenase n=1 Tax=Gudongella sp. SC589 TaxID=3385990 RepID=UPI003904B7F8
MAKRKVLIGYPIKDEIMEYVKKHCDLVPMDYTKAITYDDIYEKIDDVEGAVVLITPIDKKLLERGKKLKVVSNITVGYNNFDIDAMKEAGVIGTHSPGILDDTVADFVMGLLIATARRITELNSFVKGGRWKKVENNHLMGLDVSGTKVGIIGMGRIGEEVARRCSLGFKMEVSYYNRSRKEGAEKELGISYKPMDELLAESDFVVLLTPLTDQTHHLMGEREFSLMKENAILINASRGPVVDEKALIGALKEKKIAGAGLDVYEKEPMDEDNPLLQMDNVVLSPHIAAGTQRTYDNLAWNAARCMVRILEGEEPINVIPEMKG